MNIKWNSPFLFDLAVCAIFITVNEKLIDYFYRECVTFETKNIFDCAVIGSNFAYSSSSEGDK